MTSNNDEQLNIVEDDNGETADKEELLTAETDSSENNVSAKKRKRSNIEIVINVVLWVAILVLAVLVVLRLFVFNSVMVDGDSMTPTYVSKEIVVVNKVKAPKRGDVVVFYLHDVDNKLKAMFADEELCKDEDQPYYKLVKRVVATAGDKIWVQRISETGSDVLYQVVIDTADGDRILEDYYVRKGEILNYDNYYLHSVAPTGLGNLEGCTEQRPFVVSEGCFYAMGDHRVNSKDSRIFGEFPLSRLFGVVLDR